jgi:nucleoside-diphosphate-sugar epimerase
VADVTRLRDELGWRPARDLDAGLRDTIDFWQTQSGDHTPAPSPAA